MGSKQRLIAPTPKHHQLNSPTSSSISASFIDQPRFHRTYQIYPSFQSRDNKPIINNLMMPVFSLHAPTFQQFPSSTVLNNQNHMYMMPIPHSNSHLSITTTASSLHHPTNSISINDMANHNSHTSSLTRNRHKCDWPGCSWSFKRLEHLKRHMITHTGERKYACTFPGCGKKFGRSDNFSAHCKTHTKSNQRKSRKSNSQNNPNLDNRPLSDVLSNNLSNNMSCEMTSSSSPTSTLTQDQIDAFHYYCDNSIVTNSNSRSSISDDTNNSVNHSSVRFRECY